MLKLANNNHKLGPNMPELPDLILKNENRGMDSRGY